MEATSTGVPVAAVGTRFLTTEMRGPVVEALQRYDPGLRVRWSPERKKWALDAPFLKADPNWIERPVVFEKGLDGIWKERLLPENSERYILHRDKRYAVCYVDKVDERLLDVVTNRDTFKHKNRAQGIFDEHRTEFKEAKVKDEAERKDKRVREGFDQLKHYLRKTPWAEDGTGVSLKGVA